MGHLEPDTVQKLKARSLPDMVKDIKYLHLLYPNIPKDDVFGEFYTRGDVKYTQRYQLYTQISIVGRAILETLPNMSIFCIAKMLGCNCNDARNLPYAQQPQQL